MKQLLAGGFFWMILSLDLQAFQTRIASQGDVYDLEAGVIQFASNIVHGA